MRRQTLAALCLLSLAPACTTTTAIGGYDLEKPLQRTQKGEIVLRGADGSSVRLDPSSSICLHYVDGGQSRWLDGAELYQTDDGLAFAPDPHRPEQWVSVPFEAIDHAEVKNFSGGKTAAVVIVSAAVVAVIVAMVLSGEKGPSSKGSSQKASASKVKGPRKYFRPRASHHRGPRVHRFHRRRTSGSTLLLGAMLSDPPPSGELVVEQDLAAPPPPPLAAPYPAPPSAYPASAPAAGGAHEAAIPDSAPRVASAKQVALAPPPPVVARRLFSGRELRRAKIRLVGGLDLGSELYDPRGMTDGVRLGIRLFDVLELAGGFHHQLVTADDGEGNESFFSGYGYLGFHFELDAKRWFAIPFGLEVGAGNNMLMQTKINLGLRIQPHDRLFVGIYPCNPTYTDVSVDNKSLLSSGWSFPSALEVGFNF